MRKLLLIAVVLLLLTTTVWADGTVVTDLNTECTVAGDSSAVVTLHVSVTAPPGTESFSIPIAADAKRVSVAGTAFSLTEHGKYQYVRIEGLQGVPLDFTVTYRLSQTVVDTENGQSFDLTLLYPGWPCPIRHFSATVALPRSFESFPELVSGYYGDLIDNYMEIQIEDGVIHAVLNEKQTLQDHEALRISLALPKDYFDLRFQAGRTVSTDRLLFLMLLVLSVLYWAVFLRERPILPNRQAMPPEGGSAGEIPCVLTGRKADLALMVVHWAGLGYLTITRGSRGRIWLDRQIDMGNERRDYEITVFHSLFRRADRCVVGGKVYLRAKALAADKATDYWKARVFKSKGSPRLLRALAAAAGLALCVACFDVSVAAKSWRWIVIVLLTLLGGLSCLLVQQAGGCLLRRHPLRTALLALAGAIFLLATGVRGGQGFWMFLCLALQLLVGFVLRCGGQHTKAGRALASELLGYRRYLLSTRAASFRSILAADPQYFYRNLPYADALCAAKLFAAGFQGCRMEPCDWLTWSQKPAKTADAFYTRYVRLMAALRGEREPLLLRLRSRSNRRGVAPRNVESGPAAQRRNGPVNRRGKETQT